MASERWPRLAGSLFFRAMPKTLLPLPVPFPSVQWHSHHKVSRSILRRAHSKIGWQSWANEGVYTVNQLNGVPGPSDLKCSRAQSVVLSQFCQEYKGMGKPPLHMTPAGAFTELCHDSLPYLSDGGGPAPYEHSLLSLPGSDGLPVLPEEHLSPEHSNRVRGLGAPMLRSASEAGNAVADSGLTRPHVDSALLTQQLMQFFLMKYIAVICSIGK